MMIAQVCDLEAGSLSILLETHIYNNHIEQLQLQLSKTKIFTKMILNPSIKDIFKFEFDDFTLGYEPMPLLKGMWPYNN
jgi:thymidylate synthase